MRYQIRIDVEDNKIDLEVNVPEKYSPKPSFNEVIGCLETVKIQGYLKEYLTSSKAQHSPPPLEPNQTDNTDTKTHTA